MTATPFAIVYTFCASRHSPRNNSSLVNSNSSYFFARLMTMREKQILTSVIGSKKKINVNHEIFRNN